MVWKKQNWNVAFLLNALPFQPVGGLRPHAAAAAASMDIFYTAALDGTVKLWDLRSMQDIWMVRMDGEDEGN